MFEVADGVLINKIDALCMFEIDFDIEAVTVRSKSRNSNVIVIPFSARTGDGIEAWTQCLYDQVKAWQE